MPRTTPHLAPVLALAALLFAPAAAPASRIAPQRTTSLGSHVVLSWNDLGMHCMNQYHADLSVLPPFNNLMAQVIQRGDASNPPRLVTQGVTVAYSVPGNTYSVGKTDFWTYAPALFGVTLPNDIGLTGKGLAGLMDTSGTRFTAVGIPLTPFPDATPTVEHPYQQALVIARDAGGNELARSTPTIPVSVEVNCVSSGCHSSVNSILNGHDQEAGFNAAVRPILCAKCHASPALGTTGIGEAGYFSLRIHSAHSFLDSQLSGTAECYKCHPGPKTQCLRGAMNQLHGQACQNCHGNMANVASTIRAGRVPWVNEPSCTNCHAPRYGEEPGKLFKNSVGHGGVACEGCHNSTHADVPSREPADNANNIALQGHAGPINDCTVCHGDGVTPAGAAPHDSNVLAVGAPLMGGAASLRSFPNPVRGSVTFAIDALPGQPGQLLVYDAQGRIVRMLSATPGSTRLSLSWDAHDFRGGSVAAGTYFARWQQGERRAATRVTVVH